MPVLSERFVYRRSRSSVRARHARLPPHRVVAVARYGIFGVCHCRYEGTVRVVRVGDGVPVAAGGAREHVAVRGVGAVRTDGRARTALRPDRHARAVAAGVVPVVRLETRRGYRTGEPVGIVIGIRILPAARHCDGGNVARALEVGICGRRAVRILYGREIAVVVICIHIVERLPEELRAVEPRFVPVVLVDEGELRACVISCRCELAGEELPVLHVLVQRITSSALTRFFRTFYSIRRQSSIVSFPRTY